MRNENLSSRGDEMEGPSMAGALEGVKIIDLTRYAPGPYCTMILADLGAEVIKVEEGIAGQGVPEFPAPGSPYDPLNRNKRSIALNLKAQAGRDVVYRLTKKADVVVEGFRPGVVARLGIDYETLKKLNDRLVYCSLSGYGQSGPYRDLPGHDINYIAQAGAMGLMLSPAIPGNLIGDMAGGGMQAAIGILAALMARGRTGKGQFVDIAIADGVVSLMCLYLAEVLHKNEMPQREYRISVGAAPFYNVYETKDGKFITIGAHPEPRFFVNLCKVLGCEYLIPLHTDIEKAEQIRVVFKAAFLTKTRDEWFDLLKKADTAVGKVHGVDEIAGDPQVLHRQMVVEIEDPVEGKVRQVGVGIKLSETPGKIRKLAPRPGEDTKAILGELGYGEVEVEKLYREKVVAG
jgi:crotonobetainyl-CoA:carnitine CoA-transferase CaiB-like acyl-CoA transferase